MGMFRREEPEAVRPMVEAVKLPPPQSRAANPEKEISKQRRKWRSDYARSEEPMSAQWDLRGEMTMRIRGVIGAGRGI